MSRQTAIADQALDWLIRRDESDWSEAEQAELDAWLSESEANKAAFWRAEAGWQEADRIRSLGAGTEDREQWHWSRPAWVPAAVAASLLAVVGIGGYSLAPTILAQVTPKVQEARYDTPVGGHRVVPLADGSRIELNTQSLIRTAVSKTSRDVWLDSGEAYFEIKHLDGEPFRVHAGKQTITVLGTKFSVRRDKDKVTVNVVEGRVRVEDGDDATARAAIITAGDTSITRGQSTLIAPKSEDRVENALAWRDGMLTFDHTTLAEVAAEFNRYNKVQLVVANPGTGSIPIEGTFKASNVEAFARLLHEGYGLKIEKDSDRITISN